MASSRAIMAVLVAVALIFTVGRFAITMPAVDFSLASVYKDLAHLLVGGLFGAAIMETVRGGESKRMLWVLAGGLTGVEVIAAVIAFSGGK